MTTKKLLKWLSEYWIRHKYRMIFIVLLGIISAYLQAAIPFYIRRIINGFETNQTKQYILFNAFLILALGFIHFIVNLLAQRNRAYMNYRIEYEIRKKTFTHILKLDEFFFYKFSVGDVITRLIDDISEKIAWFSCSGVFRFIQAAFTLIAIISVMFYINPLLTVIALSPMPFMVIFIIKMGHILTKRYDELQKSISQVYDFLETSFSGIKPIKANLKEKKFNFKFSSIALNQMEMAINSEKLQILLHYIFFFSATFGIFLVYLFGGFFTVKGNMNIGDLVAFQVYVFMIIWPFSDVSQFFITSKRAAASAKRVDEILKFVPSIKVEKPFYQIHDIEFIRLEDVSLYINERKILDNISIQVKKSQRIAIVGKVGSSKSTLLKLIARLIPFNNGIFYVNGIEISNIPLDIYYSKIGYVPQEHQLISDTILNNITMFGDYSSKDIDEIIKMVDLGKDIETMPNGLKTHVGSCGSMLSGGQRQRIALARALLKKPKVLILDDATNQVDVRTERKIWQEINKMNAIVIFTTHRTSLLEMADNIYVIEKGRIVEVGDHSYLINSGKIYKKIYTEYRQKGRSG